MRADPSHPDRPDAEDPARRAPAPADARTRPSVLGHPRPRVQPCQDNNRPMRARQRDPTPSHKPSRAVRSSSSSNGASLRPLPSPHVHLPLKSTPLMAMNIPASLSLPLILYKLDVKLLSSPSHNRSLFLPELPLSLSHSPMPSPSAPLSVEPRRSSVRAARRSRSFPAHQTTPLVDVHPCA
jgi:hypothetical protein